MKFDRVRIISLADRKDRRRAMAGLGFEFFDAIRPNSPGPFSSAGIHGCYLSHLQVIQEAARQNQSVLVLEDDCLFDPAVFDQPECDLLWAGWLTENPRTGAQCIGYSAQAARMVSEYLSHLLDPEFPPDSIALTEPGFDPKIRPPFDGALVWFLRNHDVDVRFVNLCGQRSSRSDITPSRWDRIPGLRALTALARRVRDS